MSFLISITPRTEIQSDVLTVQWIKEKKIQAKPLALVKGYGFASCEQNKEIQHLKFNQKLVDFMIF